MNETSATNGRNPLIIIGGLLLLSVAFALLIFGGSLFGNTNTDSNPLLEQVPDPSSDSAIAPIPVGGGPLEIGSKPYDFTLLDLDGNEVSLNSFVGQPVIINFWATWCAPCRVEMPELQASYEAHQEEGLVILALDQDESPEKVRAFFYDEMGLTFTPLLDKDQTIAQAYGVFNYPSTFFINEKGVITAIHRGPMVQSQIEGYLAETITQ